jgi:putative membrane protein
MRFISEPTTPTGTPAGLGLHLDLSGGDNNNGRHHRRVGTHPSLLTSRRKPRRWPLVFRFIKGAVHAAIIVPVVCHAIFTAVIICLDKYVFDTVGLPSTIVC